jgi:hypothetical protein
MICNLRFDLVRIKTDVNLTESKLDNRALYVKEGRLRYPAPEGPSKGYSAHGRDAAVAGKSPANRECSGKTRRRFSGGCVDHRGIQVKVKTEIATQFLRHAVVFTADQGLLPSAGA